MEYLEHNLPDSALRAILVKAYEQFKLFHKGFHHLLASKSSLHLRETLDHFFTSYIPTLDIPTLDISTSLRGIHHLSLDKTTYLSLVSFIRDLESHLPPHTQLLFLYRHFLAWSNFTDPSALRVVYDYITDPDTGKVDDGIISQVKGKGEAVISTRPRGLRPVKQGVGHGLSSLFGLRREREKFSGFLVGPVGGEVPEPKKMYLGREGVECYVLLYQFHEDCTLPIFIPTEAPPDSDDDTIKQIKRRIRDRAFFSDLRLFFDERFPPLLKELADDWKRSRGESENDDTTARFVKLDKSNNGITTSIGVSKSSAVSEEALRNVGGLHEDFERNPNLDSVHMKTSADTWIVGQRSEHEESHFVVKKAEASLTDIEGELHKFQTLSLNNANAPAE
ncbi:vacuolar fusion protein ccz1 [Rhizophlyctis rosea]|uniref:Vacuolar fusion protein ccz1 n=1 Tax=Rhizophlyctis rosea TaxID=64517 RepID=A0AAD5SCT8_9FUNG|nr:vacuolar fusion protein ccz1 [Rhizophlyctis rosea]